MMDGEGNISAVINWSSRDLAKLKCVDAVAFIAVGLAASVGVYSAHEWWHDHLLPAFNVSPAFGDALGGFAIIVVAYVGQRLVFQLMYHDLEFGVPDLLHRMQSAHQELQHELGELRRQANSDRLTGAWSRRRLDEVVRSELDRRARYGTPLCILIVDIDKFKMINDTYGHKAGDRVLIELSNRLRSSLRTCDSLTRWGGEEFVVLCPSTQLATASGLAERLRQRVAATEFSDTGHVTISIGVAEHHAGESWKWWFVRADTALYKAKAAGRNRIEVSGNFDDIRTEIESETSAAEFIRPSLSTHSHMVQKKA